MLLSRPVAPVSSEYGQMHQKIHNFVHNFGFFFGMLLMIYSTTKWHNIWILFFDFAIWPAFPLKKKELHLTHSTRFSQCVKYDYQEIHNSFCQNSKAHRAGSTPTHECDDPLNLTLRKLWVCGVSNIFQSSIWMPSLLRNWGYEKKTKTRHHTRTVTTPS